MSFYHIRLTDLPMFLLFPIRHLLILLLYLNWPNYAVSSTGPDFTEVSNDQCLRFGYNMNGYHAGRLTVYKRVAGGPRQSVWSLAGDHGFRWHYAAVYVQMKRVTEVGYRCRWNMTHSGMTHRTWSLGP